jgi:hypothetical protein
MTSSRGATGIGRHFEKGKKSLPGSGSGSGGGGGRGLSAWRTPPVRRAGLGGRRPAPRPWQVRAARGRGWGVGGGGGRAGGAGLTSRCVAGAGGGGGGGCPAGGNDFQWCFSQVKGAADEDVAEGEARLGSGRKVTREPRAVPRDPRAVPRGPRPRPGGPRGSGVPAWAGAAPPSDFILESPAFFLRLPGLPNDSLEGASKRADGEPGEPGEPRN